MIENPCILDECRRRRLRPLNDHTLWSSEQLPDPLLDVLRTESLMDDLLPGSSDTITVSAHVAVKRVEQNTVS